MRITGGNLRGRTLQAPKGDRTRPTTDKTRQALFNLLQSRLTLPGARVLDLFCGSGALSFEALSRGAARATLVERHSPTLSLARSNAESLEVSDDCAFVKADALRWIKTAYAHFDLIVADPPYALSERPTLPDLLLTLLAPGGIVSLESATDTDFADHSALLVSRVYGGTRLSLFGG